MRTLHYSKLTQRQLRAQTADCGETQGAQGAYEGDESSIMNTRYDAKTRTVFFSSLVQVSDVVRYKTISSQGDAVRG